ncbi:Small GTPase [Entamoeba marina]
MEKGEDDCLTICLIGCERVGKTTLVNIWNGEEFDEVYSKTDDIYNKQIDKLVGSTSHHVVVWDCPAFFYRKATPLKKYLIVTKENEEDETKDILDEITDMNGLKRFDVEATDIEKVRGILTSIVEDNVKKTENKKASNKRDKKRKICVVL